MQNENKNSNDTFNSFNFLKIVMVILQFLRKVIFLIFSCIEIGQFRNPTFLLTNKIIVFFGS